jgi:hypothetical protein
MMGSSVSVFMTSLLTTHQLLTVSFSEQILLLLLPNFFEKLLDFLSRVYLTKFFYFWEVFATNFIKENPGPYVCVKSS